ncbi:MAG: hypothetical protein GEU74_15190 [Nitriliruptorales bacterium]|nr:hypothetical protein [Nitriliruptorales bacterium]
MHVVSGRSRPRRGVRLQRYTGTWDEDDPDANLKAEVAEYTRSDPLPTFERLSANTGIPVGALVRYVLVRWAAEGSEALLALGPRLVDRLWRVIVDAETDGSDAARLRAYETLRQVVSWLRVPLDPEYRPAGSPPDDTTRADGSP